MYIGEYILENSGSGKACGGIEVALSFMLAGSAKASVGNVFGEPAPGLKGRGTALLHYQSCIIRLLIDDYADVVNCAWQIIH